MSPLSIILLSPEKRCCCLNQERYMHRSSIAYKWKSEQSETVLNKYFGWFDVNGQQGMDFFNGGSIIMDYGLTFGLWHLDYGNLARNNGLKLKHLNDKMHSVLLHKVLIDGLELCWLFVDFCDVFIRCLNFWCLKLLSEIWC